MVLRETVRPADVETRKISLLLYPSLSRFLHDDYNRRMAGLVSIPIQKMALVEASFRGLNPGSDLYSLPSAFSRACPLLGGLVNCRTKLITRYLGSPFVYGELAIRSI